MISQIFSNTSFSLLATSTHSTNPAVNIADNRLVQIAALVIFILAVIHTFSVKRFESFSHRCEDRPMLRRLFHFLGEIEAVFGIWALFLVMVLIPIVGQNSVKEYLTLEVSYVEPALIFVIMTIAATAPIVYFAERIIYNIAKKLPMADMMGFYLTALTLGPLLGSFITEPAAMTVTALILKTGFFDQAHVSRNFKYATLGLLFVNISIGGLLTHFAAPPVLMVAGAWNWDIGFMITNFGWKAAIAILINVLLTMFIFRNQLTGHIDEGHLSKPLAKKPNAPIIATHIIFLVLVVVYAHYIPIFIGLFIFFIGWCNISREYQEPLKIKESLLVAFFLAGLVTLGKLQAWWIAPLISNVADNFEGFIFLGATGLTALTDNAALTYLGTLVPGLSDNAKYYLVAGAVTGGGLTVIANAPNPAGFSILKTSFRKKTISPMGLFIGALVPTFIAFLCLRYLPSSYEAPVKKTSSSIVQEHNPTENVPKTDNKH